jgi:KipI family sensor histidine kinase inhibitor
MRTRAAGDAALLVEAGGRAGALAAALRAERLPGVLDAVAGARTVLVLTEPGSWDLGELASLVAAVPDAAPEPAGQAIAEIPVRYDGPDLAEVARLTGLTAGEVVARHAAREYTVGWLGFSPGFPYLTGLDPALAVPRLAVPRLRVPGGSVAIAAGLAAVYPSESPGGWRLLGRTTVALWNAEREPPALLAAGMRVRFRPVSELPEPAPGPPPSAPGVPGVPGVSGVPGTSPPALAGSDDPEGFASPSTPDPSGSWRAAAAIEVVRPGPLATVQDLGRPALGHLGVPRSGAADTASLRRANELAGNPPEAAGLEFTLGRAVLRFGRDALAALTGAAAPVRLATGPGQAAIAVEFGAAFEVPAGALLRIGSPATGLRTYLAVRGGIDVPAVLGSRSADLLSRLGPAPLRAGDLLPVGTARPAGTVTPGAAGAHGTAGPGTTVHGTAGVATGRGGQPRGPASTGPVELGVLAGPRDDWFAAGAIEFLCSAPYVVTPASDRTGLRLDGRALPRASGSTGESAAGENTAGENTAGENTAGENTGGENNAGSSTADRTGELASEGMVTGALQVPPDGQPILLLADHPVTGGYPVIAVVRSADIGPAAQLRPGQLVTFRLIR